MGICKTCEKGIGIFSGHACDICEERFCEECLTYIEDKDIQYCSGCTQEAERRMNENDEDEQEDDKTYECTETTCECPHCGEEIEIEMK